MENAKYDRTVALHCPTCGYGQFSHEGESTPSQIMTCVRCGLELTHQELIDSNGEHIHLNVEDLKNQIVDDLKSELVKAFSGNKFIKVK